MAFKEEIEDVCGIESFAWSFIGNHRERNIGIWFKHTPSVDKPEGQPLTFEQLEALDEAFGVVKVESHSSGETGSELLVEVEDV